jgi:hypothetical protein
MLLYLLYMYYVYFLVHNLSKCIYFINVKDYEIYFTSVDDNNIGKIVQLLDQGYIA